MDTKGFNVGDTVVVRDSGLVYSSYEGWFEKWGIRVPKTWVYQSFGNIVKGGFKGKLTHIAPHHLGSETILGLVEGLDWSCIIELKGLDRVEPETIPSPSESNPHREVLEVILYSNVTNTQFRFIGEQLALEYPEIFLELLDKMEE